MERHEHVGAIAGRNRRRHTSTSIPSASSSAAVRWATSRLTSHSAFPPPLAPPCRRPSSGGTSSFRQCPPAGRPALVLRAGYKDRCRQRLAERAEKIGRAGEPGAGNGAERAPDVQDRVSAVASAGKAVGTTVRRAPPVGTLVGAAATTGTGVGCTTGCGVGVGRLDRRCGLRLLRFRGALTTCGAVCCTATGVGAQPARSSSTSAIASTTASCRALSGTARPSQLIAANRRIPRWLQAFGARVP